MGYSTEYRDIIPNVYVPNTGHLIHLTSIITNHRSDGTRYSDVLTERIFDDSVITQEPFGSSDNNELHFNIKIKPDKTKIMQCRREL